MRIRHNTKAGKKSLIAISVAVVLVAGAGIGAYAYLRHNDGDIKRDSNGISTERTPQDERLEQELKSDPSKKEQTTQTDQPSAPAVDKTTNLQQVNAVLTNSGESNDVVSASGFVSNIVESNGVCTYMFISGQKTVEKTSTTLPNANSTTCKTINFSASELGRGTWKVQLKYSSPTSAGLSNTLEVVVS